MQDGKTSVADMTCRELAELFAEAGVTEQAAWIQGGIWSVSLGIAGRVHEGSSRTSYPEALEHALRAAEVL